MPPPEQAPPVPAWRRPWSLALYGLGAAVAGVVVVKIGLPALDPLRLALLAAALILSGIAVAHRLRRGVTDLEDRTEPTCLVGLVALIAFIASLGFDAIVSADGQQVIEPAWDSGEMLAKVAGGVALFGACLVALPALPRKILASLVILFHFGGILTAVTSPPPPGAQGSWLAVQAWGNIYHPYLQFMYLNNAYHFYSPEPGPPTLFWFRVKYKSGHSAWVKLPSRVNSPIPMYYMRQVAMVETFNDLSPVSPEEFNIHLRDRNVVMVNNGIPLHPSLPVTNQYQQLSEYSGKLVSSYVRHVARTTPRPDDPSDPVVSVKFYRVTQRILSPDEVVHGISPIDKTTYLPVFCGDFDAEGKMLNPGDPMLYWLIPIYREGKGPLETQVIRDFLRVQSGDDNIP